MVVERIHEIFSFKQSKWLEKHLNFNTQKRNKVRNDFEKDFFKLLNNAFYGKTMEHVRKKDNIRNKDSQPIVLQVKITYQLI